METEKKTTQHFVFKFKWQKNIHTALLKTDLSGPVFKNPGIYNFITQKN